MPRLLQVSRAIVLGFILRSVLMNALDGPVVAISCPGTLGTWTKEALASNQDMEWLAVCSDEDVSLPRKTT